MTITYRPYKTERDIELQNKLWLEATKDLPFAWKPNETSKIFSSNPNFDPSSKYFAFQDENLLSYIGYISIEDYLPFGYPWAVETVESEVQDHLFDLLYDSAKKKYPKSYLLQRFRSSWKKQINFFLDRGFYIPEKMISKIFVLNLEKNSFSKVDHNYSVTVSDGYRESDYKIILEKNKKDVDLHLKDLDGFNESYQFDLGVLLKDKETPVAYGVATIRQDTKYSEFHVLELNKDYNDSENALISEILLNLKLKKVENVSSQIYDSDTSQVPLLDNFGFKDIEGQVYVRQDAK
jgi:hypothetical protein